MGSPLRVALLALSLVACAPGPRRVDLPGETSGPRPAPALRVEGNLDGDPHRLDFGPTPAGWTATLPLLLANDGDADLLLAPPALGGAAGFDVGGEPWPATLTPGEERELPVGWAPTEDGEAFGWLALESSDPVRPWIEVSLTAEGRAPRLEVTPSPLAFGVAPIHCDPVVRSLHLANAGSLPLTVEVAALDVFADPAEILLESELPEGPIEPGGSVELELSFAPTVEGPQTGLLTLLGDDPGGPQGVNIHGVGNPSPLRTDSWISGTPAPLDILWVIDNSSSVGDEQSAFASNLGPWFDAWLAPGGLPDWQLAVVSTDIGDMGAFQAASGQTILTPGASADHFQANANLGTGGSGIEQGFHNAWQALRPSGPNPGFLRDEAEQSDSIQGWTPEEYVAWFQGLKPDPDRVRLSAISGGLSGCSGPGGSASAGADFSLAAELTGGLDVSICDLYWADAFEDPAWRGEVLRGWLPLGEEPVEDSIEVAVEGVTLPASSWGWNGASNAVELEPVAWPEDGELVEVSYVAASSCAP